MKTFVFLAILVGIACAASIPDVLPENEESMNQLHQILDDLEAHPEKIGNGLDIHISAIMNDTNDDGLPHGELPTIPQTHDNHELFQQLHEIVENIKHHPEMVGLDGIDIRLTPDSPVVNGSSSEREPQERAKSGKSGDQSNQVPIAIV